MDFVAFVVTAANVCYNPCGAGVVLRARVCVGFGEFILRAYLRESLWVGVFLFIVFILRGVFRVPSRLRV